MRFFGQQSSGWQQVSQPHPQLLWQPQLLQPQLGAAQPQLGAAAQPQLGAAAGAAAGAAQPLGAAAQPHDGASAVQHDFSQHFDAQQLLQPQQFRPNMSSSSWPPKLWLHKPALRTSAPTIMFHFIEQPLL